MTILLESFWILFFLAFTYGGFVKALTMREIQPFILHSIFAAGGAAAVVGMLFNMAGADMRSMPVFGTQFLIAVWLAIELREDKRIYDKDFDAFVKDTGAVSFGETAFVCNTKHHGRDGIFLFWYRGARWFEPGKQFKDGIFHHLTGGEDAKFTAEALELAARHRI